MNKLIFIFLICFNLFSETADTSLTEKKQIENFHEVTSKIRCICLPSLPIKSCSFNNCPVSAILKQFIENRIRAGESANEIIYKLQFGFGDSASKDEILEKFLKSGNESMSNGIIFGFGERILAEPDSKWINLTLYIAAFLGLVGIFMYFKKHSFVKKAENINSIKNDSLKKYLDELEK